MEFTLYNKLHNKHIVNEEKVLKIELAVNMETGIINFPIGYQFPNFSPRKGYCISEEHKRKIGEGNTGKVKSEEVRLQMSLTRTGKPLSQFHRDRMKGRKSWNKGKHLTELDRLHKSLAQKGRVHSEESKRNMSESRKGTPFAEEHKENLKLAHKGFTGRHHSEEGKEKIRHGVTIAQKKLWQDPEYKNRQTKAILAGQHLRPTRPEAILQELLESVLPSYYAYTGDGVIRKLYFNGITPDFTSCDGEKKVIEVFGDYWHSRLVTGREPQEDVQKRIDKYAVFGYDCLVIWESEINEIETDPTELITKILEFSNE